MKIEVKEGIYDASAASRKAAGLLPQFADPAEAAFHFGVSETTARITEGRYWVRRKRHPWKFK